MILLKATKAGTCFNHVGARPSVTEVCRTLKLKAQQARLLMSIDPAGRAGGEYYCGLQAVGRDALAASERV